MVIVVVVVERSKFGSEMDLGGVLILWESGNTGKRPRPFIDQLWRFSGFSP
jgi:hypothetical protein